MARGSNRGALALVALKAEQGKDLPAEFRIFAAGVNKTTKGEFLFDEVAAALVMDAFRRHGADLMIDYDHHVLSAQAGVRAVAAGWCQLEVKGGELWATGVKWTPAAAAHLQAGEYRYFSPLFDFDGKTGRITGLINLALVNTPAMDGLDALVAASATQGDHMDEELKKAQARISELERQNKAQADELASLRPAGATVVALSGVIGLAGGAKVEEVQTAVVALSRFRSEVLKIAGKEKDGEAIGALTAMADQAREVATLRTRIEETETAALSAQWNGYLDNLVQNGKDGKFLQPAVKEKAAKMALSIGGGKLTQAGIDGAKEFVACMLTPRGAGEHRQAAGGNPHLTEAQRAMNRAMGVKDEDFLKIYGPAGGGGQ